MNMNIDTERLITEVRLRPSLWDLCCPLYKDQDARIKAWQEVCQELIPNFNDQPTARKRLQNNKCSRGGKLHETPIRDARLH
ncbi:unnamed protein product [Acanthoscelides obtectus]|uniref:MADF domain-containing protein n=1 Tax=Acanthoscelides obtectus TaxID=200917 RepID=A0A9P0L1T3_ACAOB|nr:unnamed protein product [Acanthoscelides obtectus]CAK1681849.1 hypothetical protein AOBTE_LOCUS33310 [Acanthoscelides obtectus]